MTDSEFFDEVESAIATYERAIRHAASRTRPMIEQLGPIEALSRLVVSADLQQGFKVLRDTKQLEKSFEALVVRFKDRFDPNAVAAARFRLEHPHELF